MQGKAATSLSGIAVVPATMRDARIVADGVLDKHRSSIAGERLLIFRGAFDPAEMIPLRRAVQRWGETTSSFPLGQSASIPGINFHRRDDGTAPTHMPHIFHQFGFADLINLRPQLAATLKSISKALLEFQNELAGTCFELEDQRLRTKVMRHPRGGGFLAPHRHPYLPQRVSLFLNLSEPGVDYLSGGVTYRSNGAWVETFAEFRMGDILAWRYDMIHDVRPVDPLEPLKWEGDDGFWIYALEMAESHKASNLTD